MGNYKVTLRIPRKTHDSIDTKNEDLIVKSWKIKLENREKSKSLYMKSS